MKWNNMSCNVIRCAVQRLFQIVASFHPFMDKKLGETHEFFESDWHWKSWDVRRSMGSMLWFCRCFQWCQPGQIRFEKITLPLPLPLLRLPSKEGSQFFANSPYDRDNQQNLSSPATRTWASDEFEKNPQGWSWAYPPWNYHSSRSWKWMVGIPVSFWNGLFAWGKMRLVSVECNEGKFPSFMPSPSSPFSWLFVPPGGKISSFPTVGGWTNPVEKYTQVKLDHLPGQAGVKHK